MSDEVQLSVSSDTAGYECTTPTILDILGSTGVVLPLVDPTQQSNFTTLGAAGAVFTWSKPLGCFDVPPGKQADVPVVTFNGIDEKADSPDAPFWSVDDSGNAGMSMGAWLHVTDTAVVSAVLSRWDPGVGEWLLRVDSTNRIQVFLKDTSASVHISRRSDATVAQGQWIFVVVTYDGTGGATAADGITIYVDGAFVASKATNNDSYVAMEDQTSMVDLGATGASDFFNGKMAGGQLGPFYTQMELSPKAVNDLYILGTEALGAETSAEVQLSDLSDTAGYECTSGDSEAEA